MIVRVVVPGPRMYRAPGRMSPITSVATSFRARSSPATPPALAVCVRPRAYGTHR